MPPKKGGDKAKSAAVTAKEEELAKQVEQMRFEKERERLRNEEFALRQRIEEEEHRLLEDSRVREMEIRNAVAERDRQANYVAREKELTAVLDQRERETQELRAKVLGLQQAQTVLKNEKDSAVRRATALAGELEAAQQKLTQAQEQVLAASETAEGVCAALRAEREALAAEVVATREQRDEAQREAQRAQREAEELAAKAAAVAAAAAPPAAAPTQAGDAETPAVADARGVDAESTALLRVLHGEVEKFKSMAAALQAELDRKARDEEKSSLLVGILHSQLDSVREENKRLHTKATKHQAEAEALLTSVDSEKERNRNLYEETERTASESAVAHRQLQLEIGVHKKQIEEVTGRLEALTEAHKSLQAEHAEATSRAMQREQEDFRANVAMKSELEKQKQELLRVLRDKQDVEDQAFNYKILTRAEMDGLKGRLHKFQDAMERKDRESFEVISALRAEAATAETARQREVNSLQLEVERLGRDLESVRSDRDKIAAELAEKVATFSKTEKDLYERLVHMTACHDAKHTELEKLQARLAAKEEAYANNAILLNAEKENLRARVEELLNEAQKRRAEHLQHVNTIAAELADLESRMTSEASTHEAQHRREKSRAELAERSVKRMQEQICEMEATASTAALVAEDRLKAAKADARELRSELAIAKRTIERLEGAFGDQAGYQQLKELNERLRKEGEAYRAQITHLNSVIVAAKLEQDVLGGYKLQKATDDVERLTRSVNRLERIQKLTLPLFRELRAVAERAGVSGSLRTSLEKYDSHMERLSAVDGKCGARGSASSSHAGAETEAAAASAAVNAAGEPVASSEFNTTLPTVVQPRPSTSSRSRIMEAFFDKKSTSTSGDVGRGSRTVDAHTAPGALPALGV